MGGLYLLLLGIFGCFFVLFFGGVVFVCLIGWFCLIICF